MSNDRDVCTSCGSSDVTGWIYHCAEHNPVDARARIVDVFARYTVPPTDDLREFLRTYAPRFLVGREGVDGPIASGILTPGSIARIVFELGRRFERSHFDVMAQEVLEAALAFRATKSEETGCLCDPGASDWSPGCPAHDPVYAHASGNG